MTTCNVGDCNNKVHAKGLCHKHYLQNSRDGIKTKTRFDGNEIIVDGDIAYVVMTDNFGNNNGRAIIDAYNVPKVEQYKWGLSHGYAVSGKGETRIRMHRLILDAEEGQLVDHINCNRSDNRIENLRIATLAQNGANTKVYSTNKSGHKGIYWHKSANKWASELIYENKKYRLGLFNSLDNAVDVHNKKAQELQDEFYRSAL